MRERVKEQTQSLKDKIKKIAYHFHKYIMEINLIKYLDIWDKQEKV